MSDLPAVLLPHVIGPGNPGWAQDVERWDAARAAEQAERPAKSPAEVSDAQLAAVQRANTEEKTVKSCDLTPARGLHEVLAEVAAVRSAIDAHLGNEQEKVGVDLDIGQAARDIEAYFGDDEDAGDAAASSPVAKDIAGLLSHE